MAVFEGEETRNPRRIVLTDGLNSYPNCSPLAKAIESTLVFSHQIQQSRWITRQGGQAGLAGRIIRVRIKLSNFL
jgi:hypothetical protein